jgi:hypothetical protein
MFHDVSCYVSSSQAVYLNLKPLRISKQPPSLFVNSVISVATDERLKYSLDLGLAEGSRC